MNDVYQKNKLKVYVNQLDFLLQALSPDLSQSDSYCSNPQAPAFPTRNVMIVIFFEANLRDCGRVSSVMVMCFAHKL
jgi:hypothetical protein